MEADDPFTRWVPAGHFYSIVPSEDDVARAKARLHDAGPTLPGIRLAPGDLVPGFLERAGVVADWDGGGPAHRYRSDNDFFGRADAAMLRAAILLHRPARVVEVGSGWSTACTLDAIDDAGLDTELTCIEPYPDSLLARLRPDDQARIDLRVAPLQEVPTELFTALAADDVLFLDSSHVFKPGSDVDDYFSRILPVLAPGVHVHVHDIHWPFEVPGVWLDEGRAWNEAHALRNFLCENEHWDITVFNDYVQRFHRDVIERALPSSLAGPGSSIWLRRR